MPHGPSEANFLLTSGQYPRHGPRPHPHEVADHEQHKQHDRHHSEQCDDHLHLTHHCKRHVQFYQCRHNVSHTAHNAHTPLAHYLHFTLLNYIKFSKRVFCYKGYFDLNLVTFNLIPYIMGRVGSWQNRVDCACPCVPPYPILNDLTDFRQTFYECQNTGGQPSIVLSIYPQSVAEAYFFPLAQQP